MKKARTKPSRNSSRLLIAIGMIAFALAGMLFLIQSLSGTASNILGVSEDESFPPRRYRVVQGEVLVRFKPSASEQAKSQIRNQHALERVEMVSGIGVERMKTSLPPQALPRVIEALRNNPNVEFAEPNHIYDAALVANDPIKPWGHDKVEAQKAWDYTVGTPSVIIAVIDTGVSATHPDLKDNLTTGYNFVNNTTDANDDHSHGTHVAGTIAARGNNGIGLPGLNWTATILPVKVLGSTGSGSSSAVANGIVYSADRGAKVINMSLSGSFSSTMQNAVKYAWDKGVVIVGSAGNNNTDVVTYPAGYSEVIAVSATTSNDAKASFSNFGEWVEVAAPGSGITSTVINPSTGVDGYGTMSGTSMSAPHVAGLAGLLFAQDLTRSNQQVRFLIRQGADDLGAAGKDPVYGYGRINAFKSLALTGEIASPSPEPSPTVAPSASPTASPVSSPSPSPTPTPTPSPAPSPSATPTPTPSGDLTPPDVRVLSPEANSTLASRGTVRVSGSASDASGVAEITLRINSTLLRTCTNTTSCQTNMNSSVLNTLSAGPHTITVTAVDRSGNQNVGTASITVYKN